MWLWHVSHFSLGSLKILVWLFNGLENGSQSCASMFRRIGLVQMEEFILNWNVVGLCLFYLPHV